MERHAVELRQRRRAGQPDRRDDAGGQWRAGHQRQWPLLLHGPVGQLRGGQLGQPRQRTAGPGGGARVARRAQRVRVRRVRPLPLPVRPCDRAAHPVLHAAGQPERRHPVPGRQERGGAGQHQRPRGQQGNGGPGHHPGRQDAGGRDAGAAAAGPDRTAETAALRDHRRGDGRHQGICLPADDRHRRQRDCRAERPRVPGR